MKWLRTLTDWHAAFGRVLDKLQWLALLAARLYIADVFLKSGWQKLTSWPSTLDLFESEYHVPLLSPHAAAVAGTFGELFFPALLVIGLFGRFGAIGLSVVNAVAVVSYYNVLLAAGFEAAFLDHVLWGSLLVGLVVFGPGAFSVDYWLERRLGPQSPGGLESKARAD